MRRENSYQAFTLVEMLIVMGIIIVLMGVGITAGRFAINRANDVAHQNSVDNMVQGLVAYYNDNREFPDGNCGVDGAAADCTPDNLIENALAEYMDSGAFDGGSDATYSYWVDTDVQQEYMVCVSLGGASDSKGMGVYCNGNAFGSSNFSTSVTEKRMDADSAGYTAVCGLTLNTTDWETGSKWTTTGTDLCPVAGV
jgi:type II secretory pathway pseudopilin PulG